MELGLEPSNGHDVLKRHLRKDKYSAPDIGPTKNILEAGFETLTPAAGQGIPNGLGVRINQMLQGEHKL
jgi:hypothetical protein